MNLDRERARRFRAGDPELFREVVEACSPRLLVVTRSFAADDDGAHDLLQETWQRAWTKRTTYRSRGSLLAWLYAVCRSVCLSGRRAQDPALVGSAHRIAAPSAPDLDAERAELRGALHRALTNLPDREREVAWLRLVEGRSTRETADCLSISTGTVKSTLHSAVFKLRQQLNLWKS